MPVHSGILARKTLRTEEPWRATVQGFAESRHNCTLRLLYLNMDKSEWSLYHTGQIKGHGGYLALPGWTDESKNIYTVSEEELQPASSS